MFKPHKVLTVAMVMLKNNVEAIKQRGSYVSSLAGLFKNYSVIVYRYAFTDKIMLEPNREQRKQSVGNVTELFKYQCKVSLPMNSIHGIKQYTKAYISL